MVMQSNGELRDIGYVLLRCSLDCSPIASESALFRSRKRKRKESERKRVLLREIIGLFVLLIFPRILTFSRILTVRGVG